MKRGLMLGGVLVAISATMAFQTQTRRAADISMPSTVMFRVLLGVGDAAPTAWDGTVTVTGGDVQSIRGWRFAAEDSSDYRSSWKVSTRYGQPRPAARERGVARGPMEDNGLYIAATLASPDAQFNFTTKQGDFSFVASAVPFGRVMRALEGKVRIERVPSTLQLTTSVEEQDHPALAQSGDEVWLAFVEFIHGDRQFARQGQLTEEPKDFEFLARPAGGDQVRLMSFSKSKRTWSVSEEVSAPKQDIMRAAVAVDGKGRVWVVWSANQGGNFDLYARCRDRGSWSKEIRLTTDPGTDLNPVAATDTAGRVWLAWQAYRNGNLEVLAAAQSGDGFSREAVVSSSKFSDWDPAIAAGRNGEVAIAWDTYDKGDYDVYARRMKFGRAIEMQPAMPVAASQNYEARPAVVYDASGRLWVAYEAADVKWGKDFGAYETTGVALYHGHTLKVKCFEQDKAFATAADLADTLPGPAGVRRREQRAGPAVRTMPDPKLSGQRAASATPQAGPLPRNTFPRLAADSAGRVYLAFRTAGAGRAPIGSIWHEQVVSFDGAEWSEPLFVPQTDGLLDNRPALVTLGPGHVLMVATRDHRQSAVAVGPRRAEAMNSDLYASEFRLEGQVNPAKLVSVPTETRAGVDPEVTAEIEQVARMRNHRVNLGTKPLRLLRGEFHRHTEISGDGGGDGPVIDAYRYLIDAAYMDWGGCCDHDNGGGREYYWWTEQKLTDAYRLGGAFIPMFSYERSVRYPEGHRNVVMAQRGVRPLARLPKVADDAPPAPAPDTQMLYKYLRRFNGIVASHTSGTNMGTDWRDNDPILEPVVEIYQGDRQNYEMPGAPRSNSEKDSIGGWRPLGFVSLALQKGYRMGFQASSDHISTHMSYCNLWVTEPTREAIMEAFHKRRVYGATDNILADVRSGPHFMGEEFTATEPPAISVKLWGAADFAKVHIIKDGAYAYTTEPKSKTVDFTWRDTAAVKGKTSYYYVRGEQADGELVWVSPMWITLR